METNENKVLLFRDAVSLVHSKLKLLSFVLNSPNVLDTLISIGRLFHGTEVLKCNPVTRPGHLVCNAICFEASILAYGWRAGKLNWPIRIQQAGKILVSWRQVKIRQLLSLEMALNINEKGFTVSKTKLVGKKWKIWTILCFWASILAPKMGHRRSAWQLARSSSSIAR